MYIYNKKELREKRRELRNECTVQEKILWKYLRGKGLGCKFRRQASIGHYIVDFCCNSKKLVIEIDGSQHIGNASYDAERTKYLKFIGYKVLRFWNNEVDSNIQGVLLKIQRCL